MLTRISRPRVPTHDVSVAWCSNAVSIQYENNSNNEYGNVSVAYSTQTGHKTPTPEGSNSLRQALRYLTMASKCDATIKRKADACDAVAVGSGGKKPRAEDEPPTSLHLPPPVWGRVLDHMPYQEVRSALLICKAISNEAVKYVHTLNIMRDCELDIPAARRFPNVEHVSVLCLVRGNEASQDLSERINFSCITAKATVPFLQIFPRLSSMLVGGIISHFGKQLYSPSSCVGKTHYLHFRSLVSSFIGAYKTRAISQELSLRGVVHRGTFHSPTLCKLERGEGDSPNECQFCRDACKYLPLKDCGLFESTLCLDDEIRDGILLRREGGVNAIQMFQIIKVIEAISEKVQKHRLDRHRSTNVDAHEIYNKLVKMGLKEGYFGEPRYISSEDLRTIDGLVESLGISPGDISKSFFYERMRFGTEVRSFDIWCKSTVDSLIARGYPIDPKDLIIVDEEQEPALQRIIQSKRDSNRS